jgi:hypothetical protein
MKASEAIDLINNKAVWRPGTIVQARVYRDYLSDLLGPGYEQSIHSSYIEIGVGFDTYNSSVINADGRYTERMTTMPYLPTDVSDIETEDELLYRVLQFINLANEHEDREFCRVLRDGQWVAPFHPHRADGNEAWRGRGSKTRDYKRSDREFDMTLQRNRQLA